MGLLQTLFGGKGPAGEFGKLILRAKRPEAIAAALAAIDAPSVVSGIQATAIKELQPNEIENLCTLGLVALTWENRRKQGGEWAQLPVSYDTKAVWHAMYPKLLELIRGKEDSSLAKKGARNIASALIGLSREQEARELLLAARPGVAADHEYLVLLCLASLALKSNDKAMREQALKQVESLQNGSLPVPPGLEKNVDEIRTRLTGEEKEVEPPQIIDKPYGQGPCDRCGQRGWRFPNMRVPTNGKVKYGTKLVCPQCGRVAIFRHGDPEGL